jgi:4-hydroxymandelate oxidase
MSDIPSVEPIPPGVVTLADHELSARTRLDDNAWAYFSGGAANEITLRANRQAWDGIGLSPRVLRSLTGGHTRTRLLERRGQ